jgi:hypothetical protein
MAAKFYQVALFLLLINSSVMMFVEINPFGAAVSNQSWTYNDTGTAFTWEYENGTYVQAYDQELLDQINDSKNYSPQGLDEFGLLDAIWLFLRAVFNSTVFLPWYLQGLGFHPVIITFVTIPVWFVYIAGIVQFVRGVGFESTS